MRTRRSVQIVFACLVLAGFVAVQGGIAQDKSDAKKDADAKVSTTAPIADSVTEGSVTVGGQAIAYRAVAGTLMVGSTDPQDAMIGLDGKYLGDAQIDLPANKTSGLIEAMHALESVPGIQFTRFTERDVVRHPLVQSIIRAYEAHRAGAKKS